MKRNTPFSPRRAMWKLICLVLGLVLCAMLLATAGFRFFLGQLRYAPGPEPSVPGTLPPAQQLGAFLDPRDVNWQQLGADLSKKEPSVLNILLIGQDRREEEKTARADSMILCTFHLKSGNVTMTSFLRDLYLPIPGHGSDRINAAYAYGGRDLLKKTITENFQVSIDGIVEADFSQFSQVIDALGGVEIQLRADEAALVGKETGTALDEGLQKLSGDQALAYSRIRSLDIDGDFSRTQRQRKVMTALLDAYRSASLPTLVSGIRQILPLIATDLSESRLLLLALEVFPMLSKLSLTSQSIPAPGRCEDRVIDGMAVLVADMEAARQALQRTMETP